LTVRFCSGRNDGGALTFRNVESDLFLILFFY
jgi:hypothetical protein